MSDKNGYKLKLTGKNRKFKVDDVINQIIEKKIKEHATNFTLLDFLQNEIGMSKTWAYNYINAANEKIVEIQNELNKGLLEQQQTKLLNEIAELKKEGADRKIILEYTKEYNKISGLYTERLNISGDLVIKAEFDNGLPDPEKTEDEIDE
jgi:hypothetical protein